MCGIRKVIWREVRNVKQKNVKKPTHSKIRCVLIYEIYVISGLQNSIIRFFLKLQFFSK